MSNEQGRSRADGPVDVSMRCSALAGESTNLGQEIDVNPLIATGHTLATPGKAE